MYLENIPVLVQFLSAQSASPLCISMCASSACEAVEGIVMLASVCVVIVIGSSVVLFLKSEGNSISLKLINFAVRLQEKVDVVSGVLSSSFRLRMSCVIVIVLLAVVVVSLVSTKGGSCKSFAWLPSWVCSAGVSGAVLLYPGCSEMLLCGRGTKVFGGVVIVMS